MKQGGQCYIDLFESFMSRDVPNAPHDGASNALFVAVYERLKAMASRQRLSVGNATLNTTALVHELYLKLNASEELTFAEPIQFFDYAAQAMRHILIDRARARLSQKRGGAIQFETELAALQAADASAMHILELDDALRKLERESPRAAQLVALHYFAGLSLPEIATMMGVTTRTLNYDWRFARAFLYKLLE
jgi:RNA polymerase sigma factor (TIGR02999 family)